MLRTDGRLRPRESSVVLRRRLKGKTSLTPRRTLGGTRTRGAVEGDLFGGEKGGKVHEGGRGLAGGAGGVVDTR